MNVFELAATITLDTGDYESGLNRASSAFADFASDGESGVSKFTASVSSAMSTVESLAESTSTLSRAESEMQNATGNEADAMKDAKDAAEQLKDGLKGLGNEQTETGKKTEETGSKLSGFASKLKSGLGTAGKVAAGAATAVVGAATAAVGAAVALATQTASFGDNIDKMSQKMGMSSDAYQEWDFIMQHSGTTIESMQSSMKTLANAAETGNDAFEKLGMSQADIANMSQEELFSATITALQGVTDETERTYLAGKLLGKGATELGPLLNTSAEDTEAMRQQVHELGGVMSADAVKASAAFADSLQNMQTVINGTKTNMIAKFLPSITMVMDGITKLFMGDSGGMADIANGIDSFAENIGETIENIGNFLTDAAPMIISALEKLIPPAITALINMVVMLINQLPSILQTLIPMFVAVVPQLVSGLASALPALMEAGKMLVQTLADGIRAFIPYLVQNGPEILQAIWNGVISVIGYLGQLGLIIIQGIWEGIAAAFPLLGEAVGKLFSNIKDWFKGSDGVEGAMDAGTEIVESGVDGMNNALAGIGESVGEPLDSATGEITEWGKNLGATALETGKEFDNQLISGMESLALDTYTTGETIAQNIGDGIEAGSSGIRQQGEKVVDELKAGINAKWPGLQSWFNSLVSGTFDRTFSVHVNFVTTSSGTGKYASGLRAVPFDDFPAILHQGEMVLNRQEADSYRRGDGNSNGITIVQNIQAVPQTPVEIAAATRNYFEMARWAI